MQTPSNDATFATGQLVGPYEIISFLAAGGMGEVYVARDSRIGRDVALKVVPAPFASDTTRVQRFEQEARAAGRLNHPHVVTVFDVGRTSEGVPYIVTELVDGRTLRHLLHERRVTIKEALAIAAQIASGLAAAHAKGIVHRDLKPANILVSRDGHVKIVDFGLAKLTHPEWQKASLDDETVSAVTGGGAVAGSLGYMAPEQAQGQPIDHRADIFAFGAVLYEMVTGRRAFHESTSIETLHAIVKSDPPSPSALDKDIPSSVSRTVMRCLAKSPDERFQSMRDLVFVLQDLGTVRGGARRFRWRHVSRPAAFAITIAAVIVAAAGIIPRAARTSARARPQSPAAVHVTPLAQDVRGYAVSRDGKFFAYGLSHGNLGEIRVRHLGSGSEIVAVPPAARRRSARFFSPGGDYLFYRDDADDEATIRRISILGGEPTIITRRREMAAGFAVSPDGSRVVYSSAHPAGAGVPTHQEVVIANADGSGERRLALVPRSWTAAFWSFAWSPDGTTIAATFTFPLAFSEGRAAAAKPEGPTPPAILLLDAGTGETRALDLPESERPLFASWMPDGRSLIATTHDGALVHVSYPDGRFLRMNVPLPLLTVVPTDDSTITGLTRTEELNVWTFDPSTGAANRTSYARDAGEGRAGLASLPGGRIAFTVEEGPRHISLWSCDADGGNRRRLTHPEKGTTHEEVTVSPDGRHLAFLEIRNAGEPTEGRRLVVQDLATGRSWTAVEGNGVGSPFFSGDGRSIVFSMFADDGSANAMIVDAAGGAPRLVVAGCTVNDVDPRRDRIACSNLAGIEFVVPVAGGREEWRGDIPAIGAIRWTPDGALAFIKGNQRLNNIWIRPLQGAPVQQTFFTSETIERFAFTSTRDAILMSRGATRRDAVLIRGLALLQRRPADSLRFP